MKRRANKVIITCAVTGSIHTPSMSPHLPITADEIAEAAIGAAEAGAAMLHLHARNPETGQPDQSPALYERFLSRIKQSTDAILNITTGGGLGMTLDQRLAAAKWAKPEVASMNMGSINFNISGAGAKVESWQHDWEKPYLEMTKDFILSNTFAQIERGMTELGADGTRFEFECYDVGHLYNLAHFVDRGIVMTGGGALIRGLDLLLSQETNLPIHVDEDPLTCVVRGTGRILDDEEKYWSVLSA